MISFVVRKIEGWKNRNYDEYMTNVTDEYEEKYLSGLKNLMINLGFPMCHPIRVKKKLVFVELNFHEVIMIMDDYLSYFDHFPDYECVLKKIMETIIKFHENSFLDGQFLLNLDFLNGVLVIHTNYIRIGLWYGN